MVLKFAFMPTSLYLNRAEMSTIIIRFPDLTLKLLHLLLEHQDFLFSPLCQRLLHMQGTKIPSARYASLSVPFHLAITPFQRPALLWLQPDLDPSSSLFPILF